jgi:hypothetical protein
MPAKGEASREVAPLALGRPTRVWEGWWVAGGRPAAAAADPLRGDSSQCCIDGTWVVVSGHDGRCQGMQHTGQLTLEPT